MPGPPVQVAPLLSGFELAVQRRLDFARRRVVAFDEVRVVAVHDPHGLGEAGGRAGMQSRAETGRGSS